MSYDLFKGYVRTKNKKCLETFKNRDDLTDYDKIKRYKEFAGILNINTVLIDVDNSEESEKLFNLVKLEELKCKVIQTTRGKHFYFLNNDKIKRCKTNTNLFVGIKADIKLGSRNSYSILKYAGKERETIYDTEEYEEVPKYLLPTKTDIDFMHLEEGDGRNQQLFNYILTLQSNDFSKEEIRKCIRNINNYIIEEPLSDAEVEVILRDEAFKKEIFFKDKTFLFDKFASFIKSNYHVKRINSRLHIYKDGIYYVDYEEIERCMIKNIPNLNRTKRKEVLDYLNLIVEEEHNNLNYKLIAFRNGVYDLESKKLLNHDPELIVRNKIKFDYNAEAYDELTDYTIDKLACNDEQIRLLIEEMIGYCFFSANELGKAFILIGDKSNGKSTFLAMIEHLLGLDNISSLDLSELGERFKTAELFNKLANIGDDIGDEFIANPSLFKKLVTGDRINVEKKGQDPFEFNNYSKLIFSANKIPRIKDKTGAVQRRLLIIPFNAKFSKEDPDFDPYIKYKLKTDNAMEYLIKIGIEGLQRVLKNKGFTKSEKVVKELEKYEKTNNPILLFFEENDADFFINNQVNICYKNYTVFCAENNFQPLSKIEFGRNVSGYYGVETKVVKINGKTVRIYVKND